MHDAYTVPRQSPHQIRNERLAIAHEMVLKTLHEAAGFPVPQQQALREAVVAGKDPFTIVAGWESPLEAWRRHREGILLYR